MNANHLITIIVSAVTIAGPISWYGYLSPTAKAKRYVSMHLIDPSSAKFRFVADHAGIICGEVNGKNRLGAYVGYRRFTALPDIGPSGVMIVTDKDAEAIYESTCR